MTVLPQHDQEGAFLLVILRGHSYVVRDPDLVKWEERISFRYAPTRGQLAKLKSAIGKRLASRRWTNHRAQPQQGEQREEGGQLYFPGL